MKKPELRLSVPVQGAGAISDPPCRLPKGPPVFGPAFTSATLNYQRSFNSAFGLATCIDHIHEENNFTLLIVTPLTITLLTITLLTITLLTIKLLTITLLIITLLIITL